MATQSTGTSTGRRRTDYLVWAGLSVVLLLMIAPFIWMFVVALSPETSWGPSIDDWIPTGWSLKNFADLFSAQPFGMYFFNSMLVAVAVTGANIVFCFLVGYAFARRDFQLKKTLYFTVLAVLMIPAYVLIIPLFILINNLGWYDTYLALIVPFAVNPLGIILVRQYIGGLPLDLEYAAELDGAGALRIIFGIIMPICRPVLAVLAIQVFWLNWNSFLFPFILTDRSVRTLPVALAMFRGYQAVDWPHLFAAASLATIPVVLLFLFFQRQIISGLTAGAVKG
ncbi:carbohydrate ABC transporter permease [Candidatus Zixiibacteriota bacterium]